jgi:hypothetical protein
MSRQAQHTNNLSHSAELHKYGTAPPTALRYRLEALGDQLTQEELNAVYQRFLSVADCKKEVFDEDLRAMKNDQVAGHLCHGVASVEQPRCLAVYTTGSHLKLSRLSAEQESR